MDDNEKHGVQDHAVLNEILDLVKGQQVSTIDFAEVTARVNVIEEEIKELRSANSKLADAISILSGKIPALLETNKKIEDKLEEFIENNAKYVTRQECNDYHKDIKSKAWIIIYPIITGAVFFAISKIFGIILH